LVANDRFDEVEFDWVEVEVTRRFLGERGGCVELDDVRYRGGSCAEIELVDLVTVRLDWDEGSSPSCELGPSPLLSDENCGPKVVIIGLIIVDDSVEFNLS
jgi:hypothetical protein